MAYHYSDPKRASDPHALPNVEVFYVPAEESGTTEENEAREPGWYFAFGFPGCLHDGEPEGPYTSEAGALAAAREGLDDDSNLESLVTR